MHKTSTDLDVAGLVLFVCILRNGTVNAHREGADY